MKNDEAVVWERKGPARRAAPTALSRGAIVKAAIRLADRRGLEQVSLRNLAAALKAGPMRLYGYVASKEELLDVMVDELYGELLAEGPLRGRWKAVLREIAHRLRRIAQRHPWFPALMAGRPPLGPHALTFIEAALAAVQAANPRRPMGDALSALSMVSWFVVGALEGERGDLRNAARLAGGEAQAAHWAYLQRALSTGAFPYVARVVREVKHPTAEQEFELGLTCVLAGIERELID